MFAKDAMAFRRKMRYNTIAYDRTAVITVERKNCMSKSIGEILRDLRKANDMTQEQVAESLGVSFHSISRWENGLSYPDVTLIPIIARFFDVSTDTLFDMDAHDREQSHEQYEREYKDHRQSGNLSACRDTMKAALEQFPRSHHFMMNLAETLHLYEGGSAVQRAEYADKKYVAQIRSLCERVLEDCKKEQERCRAVFLLCRYYTEAGNTAEALQLVSGIADMKHCRDVLLGEILTGHEKIHQLQQTMLTAIDYVATTLANMAFRKEYGIAHTLSTDERIAYVETANRLYALLMPDGNYQFFHRIVGWNHRRLAELHLLNGDTDEAYAQFLDAEKHAIAYDSLTDHHYTALFVNTLSYDPTDSFKCWEGSERGMLLYRLSELEAHFTGHIGFAAMKSRLAEATKNEHAVAIE